MTPPSERVAKRTRRRAIPTSNGCWTAGCTSRAACSASTRVSADDVVVRVLLPNALRVRLVEPAVELERVPGTALFEWTGPRDELAAPYRIRCESHDGRWHERYDPYSFPLEIDDQRSRALRERQPHPCASFPRRS